MSMIDMGVHSEKSLEDDLNNINKVLREGNTELTREYLLVI